MKTVQHLFLFFLDPRRITDDTVLFSAAESHHISGVLRKGRNEEISAVDGQGNLYRIILKERRADQWQGEIRSRQKHEQKPPVPLSLSLPCLKSNRWEILAEAACAMGVTEIWLTEYDHTAIRWTASRKERAEKKAVEALKQSGGSLLTRIMGPIPSRELFSLSNFDRILCADPEGGSLNEIKGAALLVIGPEAGISAEELELVQKKKIIRFNLGQRRLRSEIAGICALERVRSRMETASI